MSHMILTKFAIDPALLLLLPKDELVSLERRKEIKLDFFSILCSIFLFVKNTIKRLKNIICMLVSS